MGRTGQFSERVLWLCRYSISADPQPYFILACNTPYYMATRITEPSTGLEVSLASVRDLCVETYLLTRNALSVTHVTCSHVPAVCRRIHRLQNSASNISAKICQPVFFRGGGCKNCPPLEELWQSQIRLQTETA